MKLRTLLMFFAGLAPLYAELAIDPIYQSHMVLQQGKPVPVSGTSTNSAPVVLSFGDQEVKAAVKGKKWQAVLNPMAANAEGQTLKVTQGSESVVLEDVLVGEVWIASGQSNMFWRLEQTGDRASLNHAELPLFRFYHATPQVTLRPSLYTPEIFKQLKDGDMYQGEWSVSSPTTCRPMSAVGWYFGKHLQETLGVPVGVIHVSFGGSEMLTWMPTSTLKKKYKEALTPRWLESKYISDWVRKHTRRNIGNDLSAPHPYKPGYLYETGISPWVKFPVAGVIWYQGETDAEIQDQKQNGQLLSDLITGWRAEFKNKEMPFCMVQLPRINDKAPIRAYWPEFREVQHLVSQKLPKVYYSVTIDLGMTNSDVHPPRKLEVGQRLAALAAAKVYGKTDIPYSGPAFNKAEILQNDKLALSFDHAEGLTTKDGAAPVGFELSTDGKTYYPATAELADGKVLLNSAKVKRPKSVRYAWAVFLEPNLVNGAGLPTAPFIADVTPQKGS